MDSSSTMTFRQSLQVAYSFAQDASPYLNRAASLTALLLARIARLVIATGKAATSLVGIVAPISLLSTPIPPVLYILAPAIVFCQVAYQIIFYSPYQILRYIADVLFPLYVFVGVAAITGAILGIGGRMTVVGLLYVLDPPLEEGP